MRQETRSSEMDILEREERCRRALKTVSKAIIMRFLVLGILAWAALRNSMAIGVVCILSLAGILNLAGILTLWAEWKKQRGILAEDDT